MFLLLLIVSITLAMSSSDQYRQAVSGWIAPVRALVRPLSDQAALFGVLTRIHDLNLILVSVCRISPDEANRV